jgi:hypothetical protein
VVLVVVPSVAITLIVALVLVVPEPPVPVVEEELELPPPQPTPVTRKAARQKMSKPFRCFDGNTSKQIETMPRPAVPASQFME